MKVLISGASGLVGSALTKSLEADHHQVLRLVRSQAQASDPDAVLWSPAEGTIDTQALERHGRLDAVVHLAGEGIAAAKWSAAQKARIRDSRVGGTGVLVEAIVRRSLDEDLGSAYRQALEANEAVEEEIGPGIELSDWVEVEHLQTRPSCRRVTPLARKPVTFFRHLSYVRRSTWFRQDLGLRET